MDEYWPVTAAILAGAAGAMAILSLQRLLTDGTRMYRKRVVYRLGEDLKNAFIYMSAVRLLLLSILAIAVAVVAGWAAGGAWGAIAAGLTATVAPPWLLGAIKRRRTRRFALQLPDCLNAMSSSLRGGSNLARALDLAAAQQPAPISQELSVVLSEYRLGRGLEQALEDMAKRIQCQEVTLVNAAINIARTVGGNLADTFDNLAGTLREKAQVEAKIAALTTMGKMQGWVIAVLPFFLAAVLYKQEPDAMQALIFEPMGWLTLSILFVMILVAGLMIRKIVSIDV